MKIGTVLIAHFFALWGLADGSYWDNDSNGCNGRSGGDIRGRRHLKQGSICGCLRGHWMSTRWTCCPHSGSSGGKAVQLGGLVRSTDRKLWGSNYVLPIFEQLCRLIAIFNSSRRAEWIVFVPPQWFTWALGQFAFTVCWDVWGYGHKLNREPIARHRCKRTYLERKMGGRWQSGGIPAEV